MQSSNMSDKRSLRRQAFILCGTVLSCIAHGFCTAHSSILIKAITSPNSTDISATNDQASWIVTSISFGGIIGVFCDPIILEFLGRKNVHIFVNVVLLISVGIYYFANSITMLFIGKITTGIAQGGMYILPSLLASEYCGRTRRGYFITIIKAGNAFGKTMCHVGALYFDWRQLILIATVPGLLSVILTMFWPESPYHLAYKGKLKECEKSFMWINDCSRDSPELKELIAAHLKNVDRKKKFKDENIVTRTFKMILVKEFIMPLFIVALFTIILDSCGRYYMAHYLVQILGDIYSDRSVITYCSIGANVLGLFGLLLTSFFIRILKRRTLLFATGYTAIGLMFGVGIISYLKSFPNSSPHLSWMTMVAVFLQTFFIYVGVIPLSLTFVGEIFPLESKSIGVLLSNAIFIIFLGINLRITPLLVEYTGIGGTFTFYGGIMLICFLMLHFVLPETKDMTLIEIENKMRGEGDNLEASPMLTK